MATVALAGASTGFGLTMLHQFLHLNSLSQHPHKFVLLSRTSKPNLTALGIEVRVVDYADHSQLVHALKDVHTVLSTIGGSPEAIRDGQMALLRAAKEAGVSRFAPSEYAGISNDLIGYYAGKEEVWQAAQRVSEETGMQVTKFMTGIFMSILATGTPKPVTAVGEREGRKTGEEEALAGLRPWSFVINMKAGNADYPGDGSAKLVLTDMRDIATFVYHALSLDHWPREMGMRGDVKSFREIVAIVERVQRRKFLIKENSVEEMEEEMRRDEGKVFYNQCRVAIAEGWCVVPDTLNALFPEVETVGVEEFVGRWWSGVGVGKASWGTDTILGKFAEEE
ncbi:hypothetical protein BAUCODRAFT_38147 [Baudoinia panamericana UAMH 10762]|uniref:NmrA-like domain-containing protein n=1 Tax=Baudoinia panamericana (strain UAMH 10762) TaxID=717646 RepID=M2N0I2_BAUPA|nr:uncharacterized protein BAUCODRAFT_38147 [Baudoinia panamericana UAMH 10762]EMC92120.1 hypothetical protein BAUCODRAFT_38147 [Baudoinia panamericana UAMH 10762]